MNNRTLLFAHVPKTGGTTLRFFVEDQFAAEEIYDRYFDEEPPLPPSVTAPRFVRGHFRTWRTLGLRAGTYETITVLREPVVQLVSTFLHQRREGNSNIFHRSDWIEVRNHTIDDFINGDHPSLTQNLASRWLSYWWAYPAALEDEERPEAAVRVLRTCSWVGILERMEESLSLLCAMKDWRPVNLDRVENAAPDGNVDALTHQYRSRIEPLLREDTALYRVASQILDANLIRALKVAGAPKLAEELSRRPQDADHLTEACGSTLARGLLGKEIASVLFDHGNANYEARLKARSPVFDRGFYLFDMAQPLSGRNWHRREIPPGAPAYRWSGPSVESDIDLPIILQGHYDLIVRVAGWNDDIHPHQISIWLDGRVLLTRVYFSAESDGVVLHSRCHVDRPSTLGFLRLTLRVPATRALADCSGGHPADRRRVGFALKSLEIHAIA